MNVTEVPGQKGLGEAVMETPAGNPRLPTIVIVLDVAGFPVTHKSDEVRTQVTISPEIGL